MGKIRSKVMKKLVIALVVLAMATVANAELKIMVNGVIDPPDTEICSMPSDISIIGIWGDGQTQPPWDGWLIVEVIKARDTLSDGTLFYKGNLSEFMTFAGQELADMKAWSESIGFRNVDGVSKIVFADSRVPMPPLFGKLVDNIRLHPEAGDLGTIIITLANIYNPGGVPPTITVMDTQVIHTIPEPMTFALLGLGGLFLRRRK